MFVLQSNQSSTNRHKSGLGTRFHQPIYISLLIRVTFERNIEIVEEI